MFIRKSGQPLGSVLHSAVPGGSPQKVEEPDLTESEREADKNAQEAREAREAADQPPDTHALKQAWIDYAVSRGADPEEAEALTKADLIELYGGEG